MNEETIVNHPTRPDGRLRALYAAAAAVLDTASFVVQAVWLICVVVLAVLVATILAGIYHGLF